MKGSSNVKNIVLGILALAIILIAHSMSYQDELLAEQYYQLELSMPHVCEIEECPGIYISINQTKGK